SLDRKALARAGRDARPRQLPPCAAIRTAGCNSCRHCRVLSQRPQETRLMLAARIHAHGGAEVLRIDELPKPERQPGHALVRMIAGGLNRVDLYMRNSGAGITHQLPLILGLDGAGIVEEADEG